MFFARHRWKIIVALLAIFLVILIFFMRRPPLITVINPERTLVAQVYTASGRVQGVQSSQLAVETPGLLTEVLVETGDKVKKGQLLARALPDTLKARVAQATAAVQTAYAQREEVARDMSRKPLSLQQSRAENELALANARGRVQSADARLQELLAGGNKEAREQAEIAVRQANLQLTLTREQHNRAVQLAEEDSSATAEVRTAAERVREADARVQNVEELLLAAQREEKRATELYEKGAIARAAWEKTQTALANAENDLTSSKAQLAQTKVALQLQEQLLRVTRRAEADDSALRLAIAEKQLEAAISKQREASQPARPEQITQQRAEVAAAREALLAASKSGSARQAYQQAEPLPQRLARATAQIREANAALAAASAQLASLQIRAPYDGNILEVRQHPGSIVSPSQPVITISQMASAQVLVDVDEREYLQLHIGQQAIIITDADPEREIAGRVIDIGALADAQSGVVPVKVKITNPPSWLRSGLTSDVTFILEEAKEQLVLPATALLRDDDKTTVYLMRDGRVVTREVQAGNSSPKGVVILSGITENDLVVLNPGKVKPGEAGKTELRAAKDGK